MKFEFVGLHMGAPLEDYEMQDHDYYDTDSELEDYEEGDFDFDDYEDQEDDN